MDCTSILILDTSCCASTQQEDHIFRRAGDEYEFSLASVVGRANIPICPVKMI